jgi:hypothetical protein
MSEETYHLSLKGPGITINKNVDARIAAAIAHMTLGGLADEESRNPSEPKIALNSERPLSLREFLQRVASSGGIHVKIAAVGRFMRDYEKLDDFGREDIRSRFRSAGEPQPANFPRDFQKAIRAGWIAEDPQNKGRFYVTRTGDGAIEERLTPLSDSR